MFIILILSFFAGALTILAPCVLPMLPIVLGGSVGSQKKRSTWVIPLSLGISVFIFTLLLKVSTLVFVIPQSFWTWFSALVLVFLGISFLYPKSWELLSFKLGLGGKTQALLQDSQNKEGIWRDILTGAALGPVFSSCSPTYFFIIATVLPQSIGTGLIYLVAYTAGLVLMLMAVALVGHKLIRRLKWATDAHGWFKRGLGALFIILGVAIGFGLDKEFEALLLDTGIYNFINIEDDVLQRVID